MEIQCVWPQTGCLQALNWHSSSNQHTAINRNKANSTFIIKHSISPLWREVCQWALAWSNLRHKRKCFAVSEVYTYRASGSKFLKPRILRDRSITGVRTAVLLQMYFDAQQPYAKYGCLPWKYCKLSPWSTSQKPVTLRQYLTLTNVAHYHAQWIHSWQVFLQYRGKKITLLVAILHEFIQVH